MDKTLSKVLGRGRLILALFVLALVGGCSLGKDPVIGGDASVLISPRLKMVVVRAQVRPVIAVGNADHLPTEERNLVLFLLLPRSRKFSGKDHITAEGANFESLVGWDKGSIKVAFDFAKQGGVVNGKAFSVANGNVGLVAVDDAGIPSTSQQFSDTTPYPVQDTVKPGHSAPDDFLDLLRNKHPQIADFIRENGGNFPSSPSSPRAVEK